MLLRRQSRGQVRGGAARFDQADTWADQQPSSLLTQPDRKHQPKVFDAMSYNNTSRMR